MRGPAHKPVPTKAACDSKHPNNKNVTRAYLWDSCFMVLGGNLAPHRGELDAKKIGKFRTDHLYFFERILAPSAKSIVASCDSPKGHPGNDGWVTRTEFLETLNEDCLGSEGNMCHVNGVCNRELKALREGRREIEK
jgi:hypothetical protein